MQTLTRALQSSFTSRGVGVASTIAFAALASLAASCAGRHTDSPLPNATRDPEPEFHPHPEVAPDEMSTQSDEAGALQRDAGITGSEIPLIDCNNRITPPPVPASQRHIRSGPPLTNRIPPEIVQRPIRARFPCLRLCYVQALAATPGLQGRVSIQFVIDTDGWVRRSRVWQSDLGQSKVAECIARELVGLQFPPPDGKVTVVFPFALSPDMADAGS